MKKNFVLKYFFAGILLNFSCTEYVPEGSPPVEECEFTDRVEILVNNINLKYPQTMGNQFHSTFGNGNNRIINNLLHVMWDGPFRSGNKAQIKTTLNADNDFCIGSNTEFFSEGDPYININSLEILLPDLGGFLGTVTMTIRTDDFTADNSSSQGEYVMWTDTSNDPYYDGINGDIFGSRQVYDTSGNKDPNGGIIIGGVFNNY